MKKTIRQNSRIFFTVAILWSPLLVGTDSRWENYRTTFDANHIHKAKKLLNDVVDQCETFQLTSQEELPAARACALFLAEDLNFISPIKQLAAASRLQKLLQTIEAAKPVIDENHMIWEAELFLRLPPLLGRNFRRSLMSLAILSRRDETKKVKLAQAYQMQGNREMATSLVEEKALLGKSSLDGLRSGFNWSLFADTAQGIGAKVGYVDDRLGDEARSLAVSAMATLREYWGIKVRFVDEKTLAPFYYEALAAPRAGKLFFNSDEKFFDNVLEIKSGLKLSDSVRVALGGRHRLSHDSAGGPSVFGPTAEIEFDTRDSNYRPANGEKIAIGAFTSDRRWQSEADFQILSVDVEKYFRLSKDHTISAKAGARKLFGEATYLLKPDLTEIVGARGLLEGLVRDKNVASFLVEYQFRVVPWLTFGAQARAVWASPVDTEWKYGPGLSAAFQLSRFYRDTLELQLIRLRNDTIFSANFAGSF